MLEEMMAKLQKELELTGPLGEEGQYALMLDDIKISIIETPPGFELATILGQIPKIEPDLFCVKMLRGNLFGQATGGVVMGLDETGEKISLRYHYPMKPTYRDLKEKLEDFMNVIDFWKAEVGRHIESPNTP